MTIITTGDEFKEARHALGLTIAACAEFVGGVGERTVRRWEASGRDASVPPPHPAACRLMELAVDHPEIAALLRERVGDL